MGKGVWILPLTPCYNKLNDILSSHRMQKYDCENTFSFVGYAKKFNILSQEGEQNFLWECN